MISEEKTLEKYLNKVLLMDCIAGMKKLPENSIDLVIADPPYNLSKGSNIRIDSSIKPKGMGGDWNKVMESWDNMAFKDYWQFTTSWLMEAKRVLKPTGSIWVYGTYHNIGIINTIFQILEIEILNEIIWYKRNSFPNLAGRRFTASHETLLWGHKGGEKHRKYLFNYDFTKNGSFPEDLLKKEGKQMRSVWDIPNNKEKIELQFGKHPTQKPIRICDRIICSTTHQDEVVLIPFCGSGSECVSAYKNKRNFIGFETDELYKIIADKRLKNIKDTLKLF